jgi:hypothetical protein
MWDECGLKNFLIKYVCLLLVLTTFSACSDLPPQSCELDTKSDVVYVIVENWHTELGLPVEELSDNLAFYRQVFSGARFILFGYGKKTFFTAPPDTLSEYVLGPVPGPAAIQAVGLSVSPLEAYPPENTFKLILPPGGAKALSTFIWNDLTKDATGSAKVLGPSTNPDGLFYAAQSEYNLLHTCNTWAADTLKNAGLPLESDGIVFSSQVRNRITAVAQNQCQTLW